MSKELLIGGGVLVVIALLAFNKGAGSRTDDGGDGVTDSDDVIPPTDASIKAALKAVRDKYGVEIARNVERIYRLESGGLSNLLLQRTNAPGMQAVKTSWPFGWSKRGTNAGMFAPVVRMRENNPQTGQPQGNTIPFVAFKRIGDAVEYVAHFLSDYDNNAGRWKSTDAAQQLRYRNALLSMPTTWTDNA